MGTADRYPGLRRANPSTPSPMKAVAESGADVQRHELLGLDRGHSTYGASVAPVATQENLENTNVHVEATSRDPAKKYDRSIMEIPKPVC